MDFPRTSNLLIVEGYYYDIEISCYKFKIFLIFTRALLLSTLLTYILEKSSLLCTTELEGVDPPLRLVERHKATQLGTQLRQ